MARLFGAIERRTLAQTIIDQVRELIRQGRLQPGDRLPSERELSAQFGVGRSTVREATSAMLALGWIDVRPGEGAFIRADLPPGLLALDAADATDERRAADLGEARVLLLAQAARLAAQRATPHERACLMATAERMANAEPTALAPLSVEFHDLLVDAAHNVVLTEIARGLHAHLMPPPTGSSYLMMTPDDYRRLGVAVQHASSEEAALIVESRSYPYPSPHGRSVWADTTPPCQGGEG